LNFSYRYAVRISENTVKEGTIVAESMDDAMNGIWIQFPAGKIVDIALDLAETVRAVLEKRGPLPPEKAAIILSRVALFLENGITATQAMDYIKTNTRDKLIISRAQIAIDALSDGQPISRAFFIAGMPRDILPIVQTAENGAELPSILLKLSEMLNGKYRLRRDIRKALRGPAINIILIFIFLLIIIFLILPNMGAMFDGSIGMKPDYITAKIFEADRWINEHVDVSMMILGFLVSIPIVLSLTPGFRTLFGEFMRKTVPFIREMDSLMLAYRFVMTFRVMESAGNSTLASIQSMTRMTYGREAAIYHAIEKNLRERSTTLSVAVADAGVFPGDLPDWIAVSEKHGSIGKDFARLENVYRELLEEKVNFIKEWVGPIMTGVIGVIIVFAAMLLYKPMFTMIIKFMSGGMNGGM